MNVRSRAACVSAAVAAFMWSAGGSAQARDLTWDYNPTGDGVAQDGSGTWDTTSLTWVDSAVPGANTNWNNANPDSAIFGGGTSTIGADPSPPYNVNLAENITVQNLTLADVAGGASYSISGFGGGGAMLTLTLNGNLIKSGNDGFLNFFVDTNLAAGNHTVTLRDTPNDGVEFIYNGVISGSGGLTLNNDIYEAWGTLGFNQANTYTGVTNIDKGRLVLTNAGGLGSAAPGSGTNIGSIGTLSLYGAGTIPVGNLNIDEPITITRNTYAGGEFDRYRAAIIAANGSGTTTFSGPFVVDSTDARVRAESSTIVISSNITEGPTVTPGTGVLTVDGDFGGFVTLTGNNTGIAGGGIKLVGGVELNVSNHNNLGGPTAPITFAGNGTLHPIGGFMTNFGSHPINNATFSGGIDVDAGHSFTIDQNLGDAVTAVGSIGKRGAGTLNLNSTINLRGGQTFWDAGVVNVNSGVTLHSLHLRSPVVNIGTGGSVTTTTGFNSIGQDSTGTNGGPDKATVNITGTGQLIQTNNVDFNVSDNANTEGTINLGDSGVLTVGGLMLVAKNDGGKGTINQTGGTFTLNRTGNFTLVLGSRRGTGTYNMSGGTMTSAGEFYVGQGLGAGNVTTFGTGVFTMTGGTVNQNNWFVVGREGGKGTVDISGGTFNKAGGGNMPIGESTQDNLMTLRNNAQFIATTGELWVANGGGNKATLNIQDTASISLNSWFVVGRGGANGTLNMSGSAALTRSGNNGQHNIIDDGGGAASVATLSGNASMTFNSGELWVGQGGGANGTLNIQDNAAVSVHNNWVAIGRAGGTGVVNMSGGTFTKTSTGNRFIIAAGGGSNGTLNQSGGTVTHTTDETWITEGATNGVWDMSGTAIANLGLLDVGRNGGGSATLNINNTAALAATTIRLGESGAVNGVVNQSGGTVTAGNIEIRSNPGSTRAYNLTGGALTAPAMLNHGAFNFTGGTATISTINGTGTTTVGPAVSLTVNQLRQNSLVIQGTAKVNPEGGAFGTTMAKSISVTGLLDQSDNDFIVDYNAGDPSPEFVLRDYVKSIYQGGTTGIAYTVGAGDVAIAVAERTEWGFSEFNGVALDTTAIVGKYTYFGDANLDGKVTSDDYVAVDVGLGTGDSWVQGDFNFSGTVTSDDYVAIDVNLGKGSPTPLAFAELKAEMVALHTAMFGDEYVQKLAEVEAEGFAALVPEPGALSLVGLGAVALLGRRRRRAHGAV